MPIVEESHAFWPYGQLSKIELLSLRSFIVNGYDVNLWTYGEIHNAPSGVRVRNAREVLPESEVFLATNDRSYAQFSDVFRYALLMKYGGLYFDADVVALKPSKEFPRMPFLVQERNDDNVDQITNNLMYDPKPYHGSLIHMAFLLAKLYPKEHIRWCEIGPDLLGMLVKFHPSHGFCIMPTAFAEPFRSRESPQCFFENREIPDSHFVHLYHNIWNRLKIDTNTIFPAHTLIGKLQEKYLG